MIEVEAAPDRPAVIARVHEDLAGSDWRALANAVSDAADQFDVDIELFDRNEKSADLNSPRAMQIGFNDWSLSPTIRFGIVLSHSSPGQQTQYSAFE